MLFRETLDKLRPTVKEAVDEVLLVAQKNQTHEQDLLLIEINGLYNTELPKESSLSPFMFGPDGLSYLADRAQYEFYDSYRRAICPKSRSNFMEDCKKDKNLKLLFKNSIQMELMIYMKFWESTPMLKKLYQLTNLALGNKYEWYFNISKDDSRHLIIREKIRDPIKEICPKYYALIKDIYLSQIRNAAAHSDYYIRDNQIGFCNYAPNNHAPLTEISIEEWEEKFHKLILFYDELILHFNKLKADYIKEQEDKEFGLPIRLTDKNGSEKTEFIKYAKAGRLDWIFYKTWEQNYKNK